MLGRSWAAVYRDPAGVFQVSGVSTVRGWGGGSVDRFLSNAADFVTPSSTFVLSRGLLSSEDVLRDTQVAVFHPHLSGLLLTRPGGSDRADKGDPFSDPQLATG